MKLAVFDIGGTMVKTGYFSESKLIEQDAFATPATFAGLIELMHKQIDSQQITGIALSAPGVVDNKKRIVHGISAVPYLHHCSLFSELENEFGLPVTVENDANCAGLCEVSIGAGKGFRNVAFVVVGTGIGGAVFINKILYKGSHLFSGEFGLMKAASGSILSTCSTIVKAATQYERQKPGTKVDGKKLFVLAECGDRLAQTLIAQVDDNIALALYNIQVAFDFDAIIIGGGVSAHPAFSRDLARRLCKLLRQNQIEEIMPEVKPCHYHNAANLYGAAYNFLAKYKNKGE